ncbi:MAG: signal recognition particle protein [Christensenellales bacterium]
MAFEGLADKLQAVMKKLTGRGKLSESDIKAAMREVRMALLEADVNFLVVKDFVKKVSERAVGQQVLDSLTPGQQVIKIVNEELTDLMGATDAKITFASEPPTVIMLCGLQGAGKTTLAAKLALYFKKQGRHPMLVACDVYRPAAIKQLQVVGGQAEVPVFEQGQGDPVAIAQAGLEYAKYHGRDIMIVDTAGRLHIDEALMEELTRIKRTIHPNEILLVVDAMTGQDAVNVASSFNEQLAVDGVVLSKLDGDTRGGAALSVKAVTGKPIKFASVGEKITDLEPFHPDRMASRILGMGDVLSLIEKAQSAFDEKQAEKLEQKLRSQTFTLEDFLDQLRQVKKMGSMDELLGMLPGVKPGQLKDVNVDEKQMARTEAVILSMTPQERENPGILNYSRRKRIAAGSGTTVTDVNRLIKQFDMTKQMMKQFTGKGKKGKRGRMPFGFPPMR